jgi:hypothetical protein
MVKMSNKYVIKECDLSRIHQTVSDGMQDDPQNAHGYLAAISNLLSNGCLSLLVDSVEKSQNYGEIDKEARQSFEACVTKINGEEGKFTLQATNPLSAIIILAVHCIDNFIPARKIEIIDNQELAAEEIKLGSDRLAIATKLLAGILSGCQPSIELFSNYDDDFVRIAYELADKLISHRNSAKPENSQGCFVVGAADFIFDRKIPQISPVAITDREGNQIGYFAIGHYNKDIFRKYIETEFSVKCNEPNYEYWEFSDGVFTTKADENGTPVTFIDRKTVEDYTDL